ncbi:MAG: hypothetical protein IPL20_17810 [Saprospiraceae bacterium]|nr:hypothetical protein [Saprospiraceae bacterium]
MVTASGNGNIVLGETFNGCAKPENWQTEIVNGVDDWQFEIFTTTVLLTEPVLHFLMMIY